MPSRGSSSKSRSGKMSGGDGKLRGFLERELSAPVVSSQARFLYQYIDPGSGCYRGPTRSNLPTWTYQTTSFTDVTVETNGSIAWNKTGINYLPADNISLHASNLLGEFDPYFNGNPSSAEFSGTYYMPSEGAPFTIVGMPHRIRSIGGAQVTESLSPFLSGIPAATTQQLCSGFIVPSNTPYATPMYTSHARTLDIGGGINDVVIGSPGYMFPLNPLTTAFTEVDQRGTASDSSYPTPGLASAIITQVMPFRVTGVIMEVENISPPIYAKGIVVGGDNRSLYCSTEESSIGWQTSEQLTSSAADRVYGPDITYSSNGLPNPSESVFTGPTMSQNRRDLGHFDVGPRYRAAFIPSNDRILDFRSDIANFSCMNNPNFEAPIVPSAYGMTCSQDPNSAVGYYSTLGEMLCNNPAPYITISGWQNGMSIRIKTTINYELLISNSSPLALLMSSARFSSNYLVNWAPLQGLYSAGKDADNIQLGIGNRIVVHGMASVVGAASTPPPTIPIGWNIGVQSQTQSVVGKLPPRIKQAMAPTLTGHASNNEHGSTALHVAEDVAQAGIAGGMAYANRGSIASTISGFVQRVRNVASGLAPRVEAAGATIAKYGKGVGSFFSKAATVGEEVAPLIEFAI